MASSWYKGKSCGELYFEAVLTYAGFPPFVMEHQVGYYRLDFAWPKRKLYFEVDGDQHYTEDGIKHDKRRTEYLKKLGWICIGRVRWTRFKELSLAKRTKELVKLKKKLIAG